MSRQGRSSRIMKILHVCNWCSGITTRNVAALKQFSRHSHELVTRLLHPYDMAVEPTHLTERDTTREMVLDLAEEADALHFHAVGYDGSEELTDTIHGIDWSRFLGKKLFVLHAMCSYLHDDGETYTFHHQRAPSGPKRFRIAHLENYDALMGPHLSCKKSYEERLEYVPDIVPIWDWLYTPHAGAKRPIAATFKEAAMVYNCRDIGVRLDLLKTPTKLTEQLDWRRKNCKAVVDNTTDGHWGLMGIESLAHGIPCFAYTHPINLECWDVLGVRRPPFKECEYGGAGVPIGLRKLFSLPEDEWQRQSVECRRWVEECYAPRNLVRRWDAIYDAAFIGNTRTSKLLQGELA